MRLFPSQVPRVFSYGKTPLVNSPFCTTAICGVSRNGIQILPKNVQNLHSAFVSEDDRVLLKSLSYGDARIGKRKTNAKSRNFL